MIVIFSYLCIMNKKRRGRSPGEIYCLVILFSGKEQAITTLLHTHRTLHLPKTFFLQNMKAERRNIPKCENIDGPSLATSLAVIDENKCPETFEIKASSSPLLYNGIKEDDKEQVENWKRRLKLSRI
ncbi:hypothetical protein KUTeg_000242 [Tegillarca granosa]|uniref:Uncharacterized protein n=1 Tax=Tegillarca granosa TaxID=220873 RepID=A0ABQ9FX03_TEGGR|nr:hypothetical protein KUTeg_000242 [Tegillarca granosa]